MNIGFHGILPGELVWIVGEQGILAESPLRLKQTTSWRFDTFPGGP